MSFRSSAVLTTTPFWSGTSWTSRPTASQRDGLPPAPTLTFLDSRWRHPHTLSWRSPGLFGWWVRPSFLLPPRHLSVHPDPDTSSSCPFWQTLELVPIACQYSHMHTQTHRPTLMRIPYYRINATPQRSSSSSTNLCFVKYTNDSINLDLI